MPTEQQPHFLELRRQIDDLIAKLAQLRAQENELLRQMFSETGRLEVPLQFDDETQTVMWFDKSLKLGGKSYQFLKTLWQAPRRRKKIEGLESTVWKSRGRKQSRQVTVKTKKGVRNIRVTARFLSQNTLKLFLFRLHHRLRRAQFPYKIVPVKNGKIGEIVGYGLKCIKRYVKFQKKYRSNGKQGI